MQSQLIGLQHDPVIAARLLHCRIMHCQALQHQPPGVAAEAGGSAGQPLSAARLAAEVQALADSLPLPPALQVGVGCARCCVSLLYHIVCTNGVVFSYTPTFLHTCVWCLDVACLCTT